jgi:lipopolysaccharide/colanic/teichoic acid biosynthesis glycosyltransferase
VEDLILETALAPSSAEGAMDGMLTSGQALRKRAFDLVCASVGLVLLSPVILIAVVAASIDTRSSGLFIQDRIGRRGRTFRLVKIKTMRPYPAMTTSVTASDDPRITPLGKWLRRHKIDELPQLANVVIGQMSLVGPRPEVPGFADELTGHDALILTVRPGITGPATLHFRNEEELLRDRDDPEAYNRDVLFPSKVRMNVDYVRNYSFRSDLDILWKTIFGSR